MAGQILIVEDDADVAHVAEAFLKREGYLVEVARDGLEGLDAALAIEPDLIVLDSSPPFVAPDTSSNDAGVVSTDEARRHPRSCGSACRRRGGPRQGRRPRCRIR